MLMSRQLNRIKYNTHNCYSYISINYESSFFVYAANLFVSYDIQLTKWWLDVRYNAKPNWFCEQFGFVERIKFSHL